MLEKIVSSRTRFLFSVFVIVLVIFDLFLCLKIKINEDTCRRENVFFNEYKRKQTELINRDFVLNSQIIRIKEADILPKSFQLIYSFEGDECSKCVMEDVILLKKVFGINSENVLVLPVLDESRETEAYLNSVMHDVHFRRLNKDRITFPQYNGHNVRFLTVINSSGELLSRFYPVYSDLDRTRQYLDFVNENYFLHRN